MEVRRIFGRSKDSFWRKLEEYGVEVGRILDGNWKKIGQKDEEY